MAGDVCGCIGHFIAPSFPHTRLNAALPPRRVPDVNMGQYTMLWDKVFGTFRDYTVPKMYKGKST